ncbi:MAG: RNA pseudouridine synthase [Parachlamydiales bacterium]|nr:RNA pseudouridine synthase [Parachlamydiales bacterium]
MKYVDKEKTVKLLYCDNHIIVVTKPSNLLTQKEGDKPNLQEIVAAWVKKEFQKKGNVFLHPIHRLDKPVSGLVLFARTSKALSRLNQQMREHKIERIYIAWIEGRMERKQGALVHSLRKKDHYAVVDPCNGKEAMLTYEVIREEKGFSLVRITLVTGRYHQIRVQFGYIHHPIVGDQKYGSSWKRERLFLHHTQISFFHPVKGEKMSFKDEKIHDDCPWEPPPL